MRQILAFLNETTLLQYIAPVRGPPLWEMAYAWHGEFDARAQPAQSTPDCEFNQRISGRSGDPRQGREGRFLPALNTKIPR